ncbi:MAG TPA: PAS domain S-box protein, partial [bacterium]|nr:PAS domain S-box protein [bacterium]
MQNPVNPAGAQEALAGFDVQQRVQHVQARFIENAEPAEVYALLLDHLLVLTQSRAGCIGDVQRNELGQLRLEWRAAHALAPAPAGDGRPDGLALALCRALEGAQGQVEAAGEYFTVPLPGPVDAVAGAADTGASAALGIPLRAGGALVGLVGLVGPPGRAPGPPADWLPELLPLLAMCRNLLKAYRGGMPAGVQEAAQDRFRAISQDMPCVLGTDGYLTRADPLLCSLLGLDEAHLLATPLLDLIHPEDREASAQAIERLRRKGTVQQWQDRVLQKDGAFRWISWRAAAQGDPGVIYMIARDITRRVRAEARLAESEDRYRTVISALGEGIVIQNQAGEVVACNPAAQRILRLSEEQILGRAPLPQGWSCLQADGTPVTAEGMPLGDALRTGQQLGNAVLSLPQADGSQTWISVSNEPLRPSAEGAGYASVSSIVDITQFRRALQALELAKEKAEEATHLKDKFVSLVAHDLRAPMASVIGTVGMLLSDADQPLTAMQRETLGSIEERLRRQLDLVEQVLKISALQTGKLRVRKRRIDAGVVVVPALGLRYQAEQKGVRLLNEVPDGMQIAADPLLFGQVLQNLVSNAIKFSKKGDIVRLFAPAGRPNTLAVQDTGTGIPARLLPDLFRADVKTTAVGTAGERGTGMGLPLSYDIILAHGGKLDCETREGQGTTFYAELPEYRPVTLVVDDDDGLRLLFKRHLAKLDCDVLEARNGEEALTLLREHHPTLIISDILMPRMDGFELLNRLKMNPDTAGIPVIVVTVGTDMEARDKAFA